MNRTERLWTEYGLEDHCSLQDEGAEASSDGGCTNNKLQIALTNSLMVLRDGTPAQLTYHLLVGSLGSAYNLKALQDSGVTHILCLSATVRCKYPAHFLYKRMAIADQPNSLLASILDEACAFIESARLAGKVLVHCYQGISRSAAVCCAYLMRYHLMSLDMALGVVWKVRPQARPNSGFMTQLRLLEAEGTLRREIGVCNDTANKIFV